MSPNALSRTPAWIPSPGSTEPVREQSRTSRARRSAKPSRRPRLAALDGVRFCAALMVVLYHYAGNGGGVKNGAWDGHTTHELFGRFSNAAAYGWMGVELFFLISGFVICMSSWGRTLGDFFRSRVVRLYPAYWFAVLAASTVLLLWPEMRQGPSYTDMLMNLTMLHEPMGVKHVDGVYWTLWVELRFYLLFGLTVVWRGLTYRRAVVFCALWLSAVVMAESVSVYSVNAIVQPSYAPYFIGGVGFYLMYRYGQNLLLWGIVGISWMFAQHFMVTEMQAELDANHPHLSKTVCLVLVTVFYLVMAAIALGWLDRVTWRGLTFLGVLTYPLYLVHEDIGWTVIHHLYRHHPHPWAILGLVTAGALVAAYLVNLLVERPLSRLLGRSLATGLAQMRNPVERVHAAG